MAGLLRICTAGSVDDGKSTLIGRLLYDSRGVYEDQLRAVTQASVGRGTKGIDFSLFTDGLRAEREQNITIDVAYRYFATARRKFILADTPGHEQYTRNMATGASTADVAILLVDARNGVRPQSRRHARIAQLLGITRIVLAVNKMDLVDFDRAVFDRIVHEFGSIVPATHLYPIPVSALDGDNVITPSARTPWFTGTPLLEYLETVEVDDVTADRPFRMPVQLVVRPNADFRGYAGQIASGTVTVGQPVRVFPDGHSSRIARVVTYGGDLAVARAGQSVTLTFEDAIDVSRGDLIATGDMPVERQLRADVVWMDESPLDPARTYRLKHGTRTITAEVDQPLALNEIGAVVVSTRQPLPFDAYADNRTTGSFILIDPATNFTAGAGMIIGPATERAPVPSPAGLAEHLAALARGASSEREAAEAIRRALEEFKVSK